jgi:hypothetical protein
MFHILGIAEFPSIPTYFEGFYKYVAKCLIGMFESGSGYDTWIAWIFIRSSGLEYMPRFYTGFGLLAQV